MDTVTATVKIHERIDSDRLRDLNKQLGQIVGFTFIVQSEVVAQP